MKKEVEELQEDVQATQTLLPEELEEIRTTLTKADKLKYNLAELTFSYELNKGDILEQLKSVSLEIETVSQGLNAKYGEISVDIATGVITQK